MNSREDKMIRAMHIINRCVAANSKKEDEDAGIEALEF